MDVKQIVKESYKNIAKNSCKCACKTKDTNDELARNLGYSEDEITLVPEANLGLGCGNPTNLGKIDKGMSVVDLGSGAGFDCFIVSKMVGESGKVIGVDITQEMINKAKDNAVRRGFSNVEFRLGDIEDLPIESNSIDVVISNCVINLAPNKLKVFKEAFRVLKVGGKLLVSDIVLLEELSEETRNNEELIAGCVGGALLKEEYLSLMKKAGFRVEIISEDKDINKRQYHGMPLESLKVAAFKE